MKLLLQLTTPAAPTLPIACLTLLVSACVWGCSGSTSHPELQAKSTPSASVGTHQGIAPQPNIQESSARSDTSPTPIEALRADDHGERGSGDVVQSAAPPPDNNVPPGATAVCSDGTYSFSESPRVACSHHGGVAEWLDSPTSAPSSEAHTNSSKAHISTDKSETLDEVTDGGKFVKLLDGSLWEVDEIDRTMASEWLNSQDITLVHGSSGYKMVNKDANGETIHAHLVKQ